MKSFPFSKSRSTPGFTVLEFLIILGIMSILIALVLIGLANARARSRDETKIAHAQTIAVGLAQFFDVCRTYPAELNGLSTCPALQPSTIVNFIPEIDTYQINFPDSVYHYVALAADPAVPNQCTNFHLWVQLESNDARAGASARYDSTQGTIACSGNVGTTHDAPNDPTVFDLYR